MAAKGATEFGIRRIGAVVTDAIADVIGVRTRDCPMMQRGYDGGDMRLISPGARP